MEGMLVHLMLVILDLKLLELSTPKFSILGIMGLEYS